jgi:hypothetical protein
MDFFTKSVSSSLTDRSDGKMAIGHINGIYNLILSFYLQQD